MLKFKYIKEILKAILPAILIFCSFFSTFANQPKFHSVNALFSISLRNANSVCEDKNGFIWASFKTGIVRLTNDDYKIYNPSYENSDVITLKLVYKNSKLIAYSNNGQIFLYNTIYDRFDLILNMSTTLNDQHLNIYGVLIDNSGSLWIASTAGLFKYESGNLILKDDSSLFSFHITWYNDQQLIITKPQSIWLYNINTSQSEYIYGNSSTPPNFVSSLYFDKEENKLWIGTVSNGLFLYDFHSSDYTGILESTLPKQPILAIEKNTDSTLLVGVDGQGLWELHKKGKLLNVFKEDADDPSSINGNGIYDIYCDKDKRVWVCTISGGVSYFDQASQVINQITHQINNTNSLVNNEVNCIIEDNKGILWFATNNGISRWEPESNNWKSFYHNEVEQAQVFLTLCNDDQGRIWAGSYSSGVYLIDGETGKELAHYPDEKTGLPRISNFIFDVFKDSQGDIWIGGINAPFVCYLSKENKFKTYNPEPIGTFAELSPGHILLGCSYGLKLLDKQTGISELILPGMIINDIYVDDSDIWVCTVGEGLVRLEFLSGKTEKFTTESGLPSNYVNSIVYADGYLWLGTENGLCRFNPDNKKVFTFLSEFPLSGISYNSSNPFLMQNGQLAWGTNNGAVLFNPQSILETHIKGRIYYQDIKISGRSIRELPVFNLNAPIDSIESLKLNYLQNNLVLELLPVDAPPGSRFSWKMEEFDEDWIPTTNNRIITYTNLPSGKFKLKVRLYDNSLSRIIAERSINLKLIPPFWKSVWFFIIIAIIVSGLIFMYFLYYTNNLKKIHTEEKVRFFTNTAHDIRTSLTLIKAPVEELNKEKNLSETGKNYLQLAIEQARRLSSVVTKLMDFQKVDIGKEKVSYTMTDIVALVSNRIIMFKTFAKSKNIKLIFNSDCDWYSTAVDETKIEKIVDNLISNAIKYSHPDSQVLINLNCEEKNWIFEIKDQGIGINRKAQRLLFKEFYRGDNAANSKIVGSGIGLLLVKNYVNMHNGSISFQSRENEETTFRFTIPFKKVEDNKKIHQDEIKKSTEQNLNSGDETLLPILESTISDTNKIKILIVEDNNELLNFMQEALNNEFKTYCAADGSKAWQLISKRTPDIIVSDIMMPKMDGFELCQKIKSTYETSHIPVILLTALSEKTEQLHGLGLGADDYLTKPFDMNLLVQRIKTIIKNREVVREKALKLIDGNQQHPMFNNDLNDRFVKKLLEVVNANISNTKFNKDEFAAAMNMSPSLLYKKIKSFTNLSPTDFIKTVRIKRSLVLIKKRNYTVTEVSELCGFASVAYFSTVFRKFYGKSPTEFLK